MVGVGISGTGRIGRLVIRRAFSKNVDNIQIKVVNSTYPVETIAHLLKYDTIHGIWDAEVAVQDGNLIINGNKIHYVMERDPARLPWKEHGVTIAIDATGKFNDREGASKHIAAGAEHVILTAPGKQVDLTVVMGVNDQNYDPARHRILSAASCTTNCVAPVLDVLDRNFGVKQGWMTTVHAYTSDQNHMDNPHKDLRRARGCAQSIIPTSTGVGKALTDVLPHLAPLVQGISLRVPTPDVSLVDLTVHLKNRTTTEEVKQAFTNASSTYMKSYMDVVDAPLVSSDYIGNSHSAIIDAPSLMVSGDQLKVLAWYDNEWGYSCRVMDLAQLVGKSITSGGVRECEIAAR
ncbi:type I glyceraldehyde-3-phosphate dehydrogenase [Paenibacillus sp. GSMTC-2017]|uniref:type I glyceraldehyde-3-phosphate dehydrogenase n=1 Tax=Paenibacillus sp. GSMTC-2017 TaxID=2794350 RepID=UPI0018D94410|nr:type I glyceraldehyde-3-phosphate dehydrogenase [Paenibacillus sp. GSMTC-2017]MBH5318310.1 type I glyceraldehyde-3-phosphate dehydrogenase [Paenibacillus sp. GSMTC-2017]